ncbi:hypothetical protein E2L08_04425 [Palleronia sediminis]|uniref:PRC-barrel domain-containing protein n=1 Tax=Palleronia sediminis TaxID=2547833 RepID=A0A4R6AFV1_9RHOB|nr:PRC-barrel domain-containing protein [Palleronia sediminis]TDL81904.1 hypothetical protein E2L08_04425 [Palleronia sediminis]
MKTLLSTTAAATLAVTMLSSAPAMSQTDGGSAASTMNDSAFAQVQEEPAVDLFASDLLGTSIYSSESDDYDAVEGVRPDWNDIGEINDLVLGADGKVDYAILGIGGFLGIGERDVAVRMDRIEVVRDGTDPSNYYLVINATQEELESAPEFSRADLDTEGGGMATDVAGEAGIETDETVEGELNDAAQGAETAAEETGDAIGNAADDAAQATENAAEETGEALDNAADATGNAVDDAAQATENAAEETGEALDNAADATGDAAQDATEETGEALENAGEELQDTAN